MINWVKKEFINHEITLFGHSRGGAISILKSSEDATISNVISWASPSNLMGKLPSFEKAKKWMDTNVAYVYNGRIKKNMPLYYQFYENCMENAGRLNIKNAVINMKSPHLHVHGDADPNVLIDEAESIRNWNPKCHLHIIKGANHVFDGCHPYNMKCFPKDLQEAVDTTFNFLK